MGEGPGVIRGVGALGAPVFADAKLHDIPNTVGNAARQLGKAGARWVTVHGAGGSEMIEAAVNGLNEGSGGEAGVLVVTVLTSLDEDGLRDTGVDHGLPRQVATIAKLAARAGAEGVVSSILEVPIVKEAAPSLKVVTPGIRAPMPTVTISGGSGPSPRRSRPARTWWWWGGRSPARPMWWRRLVPSHSRGASRRPALDLQSYGQGPR